MEEVERQDQKMMLRKLYTNFKLFDFIQEQSLKLIRDLLLNYPPSKKIILRVTITRKRFLDFQIVEQK